MSIPISFERLRWAAVLLVALTPLGLARAQDKAEGEYRVTIRGNGVALGETPIHTKLDDPEIKPGPYQLRPASEEAPTIEAQVYKDGGQTYLDSRITPALSYTMVPSKGSPGGDPGVQIEKEGKDLRVLIDGELFTVYQANDGPKPYFHPIIGPTGVPITRAYPMRDIEGEDRDHPHQRSFWFTHGNVNGVDFWASDPLNRPNPKFGTIQEIERPNLVSGPVVGVIRTIDEWRGPDGKVLCQDERVWRTYDTEKNRVIDFDVTIKATEGPVTFGDTKEGMFGLRLASSMNVKRQTGGKITNAEGITNYDAWGQPSPWVDYAGPLLERMVGAAILNHPDSFRYPTTWHVRDYGLFAANPFGYSDFKQGKSGEHTIPAGESIQFRYRVIFHTGGTEAADIPEAFDAYANPPEVDIAAAVEPAGAER